MKNAQQMRYQAIFKLSKQLMWWNKVIFLGLFLFLFGLGHLSSSSSLRAQSSQAEPPVTYDHNATLAQKYFNQGLGFYNAKSYKIAVRYFFTALQYTAPEYQIKPATVRYFLGLAYLKAGYLDEALKQWQNVVDLDQTTPSPAYQHGQLSDLTDKRTLLIKERNTLGVAQNSNAPFIHARHPLHLFASGEYARGNPPVITYFEKTYFPKQRAAQPLINWQRSARAQNAYTLITPIALAKHPHIPYQFYVADLSTFRILTLDNYGNYVNTISPYRVPFVYYPLKRPYDLAIDASGNLWVTDLARDQVVQLSPKRKILQRFGKSGIKDGELLNPKGITIGPHQTIWVADTGNARLQVFSPTGEWIRTLGTQGSANGNYLTPTRLRYDAATRRFYVLDALNKRIQLLDESGQPLTTIAYPYFTQPLDLQVVPNYPNLLLLLDKSGLYVIDVKRNVSTSITLAAQAQYLNTPLAGNNNVPTASPTSLTLSVDSTNSPHTYKALMMDSEYTLKLANSLSGQIEVYQDLGFNAANGYLEVEHVEVVDFPKVRVDVKVRHPNGHPVSSLNHEQFVLTETGRPQSISLSNYDHSAPSQQHSERLVVLIEVPPLKTGYTLKLQTFFRELLENLPATTQFMPILYGVLPPTLATGVGEEQPAPQIQSWRETSGIKLVGDGAFFTTAVKRSLSAEVVANILASPNNPPTVQNAHLNAFGRALQLAIEQLLPYRGRKSIILFTATPHPLAVWQSLSPLSPYSADRTPATQNSQYTQLLQFAKMNDVAVYAISTYTNKDSAALTHPLRRLAIQTGGEYISYGDLSSTYSPATLVAKLGQRRHGRYALYYSTQQRTFASGKFIPIAVRATFNSTSAQDTWNGFIYP